MKKLFLLVLLVLALFVFVGCSGQEPAAEQLEIVQDESAQIVGEETGEIPIDTQGNTVQEEQALPSQLPSQSETVEQKPILGVKVVEETVIQPTLVRECGVLGAGSYVLAIDVMATGRELSTPCLTLSSDTILDCNGHHIFKKGVDEGQGIAIIAHDVHDITIKNCNIENFRDGIDVVNVRNALILSNHVSNQKRDGIRLFDGSELRVENNTLRSNSQAGFFLNTSMSGRSWAADVYFNGNDACGNLDRDYKCLGNFVVSGSRNYFERLMECRESNAWPVQDKNYVTCHDRNSFKDPSLKKWN
ncbi:right-handed parallel beta-helix repeat-containing protein [Candidatus Woesearchaeota archaeon]|nr:right-handed parallel beta-helix repeat-containing protein [Candidatus Woesearchaeota archaeon]